MANLVARFKVADVQDHGQHTKVVLRPTVGADSPNAAENAALWVEPTNSTGIEIRFKSGAGNPFVKNGQVTATFAAG